MSGAGGGFYGVSQEQRGWMQRFLYFLWYELQGGDFEGEGVISLMTSKERAELRTQAMKLDSIFQIGKSSLTPQIVEAVRDALKARELVKVSVLKNCADDPGELAGILSERTGSQIVQVIGKKIVLYKKNPEKEEKRRRIEKQKVEGKKQEFGARDRKRQSRY